MKRLSIGILLALTASSAGLTLAMVAPVPAGAAASTTVVYSLAGTATMAPGTPGCIDCAPASASSSGTATCSACRVGDPAGGTFSLSLTQIRLFPPNPCRVKTISGTLSVTWSDATTSTAAVSGHFTDDKPILTLTGTIDPSSTRFQAGPIRVVLNNHPPNPCSAATNAVTGALQIATG
jgi:hypothetical protein